MASEINNFEVEHSVDSGDTNKFVEDLKVVVVVYNTAVDAKFELIFRKAGIDHPGCPSHCPKAIWVILSCDAQIVLVQNGSDYQLVANGTIAGEAFSEVICPSSCPISSLLD